MGRVCGALRGIQPGDGSERLEMLWIELNGPC